MQKKWPGGKAQALAEKAAWEQFARDHAVPYVEAMRRSVTSTILKVLRPAVVVYDRLRRDAGGLNFQDLLLIAAKMLREYPPIRRYFRSRFTHLLVDEFQDTDPDPGRGDAAVDSRRPQRDRLAALQAGKRVAIRRRRPEAVDLPVSARRHRHLQRGEADHSRQQAG